MPKAPAPPNKRLAKLYETMDALQAQIRQIESRERVKERKNDTRRKILAGAIALEEKDPAFQAALLKALGRALKSDRDRALFGLPPLPANSSQEPDRGEAANAGESADDFAPMAAAGGARIAHH